MGNLEYNDLLIHREDYSYVMHTEGEETFFLQNELIVLENLYLKSIFHNLFTRLSSNKTNSYFRT